MKVSVAFPLILVNCLFLAHPRPAGATGPRTSPSTEVREVAVIVSMGTCCETEAWSAAERVLAREFRALGFTVLSIPGQASGERERRLELQDLTDSRSAACAVRIVRPAAGQGAVELWINDRVTKKMLFRQLEIAPEVGDREAEIIALRVVEMLRASLLELRLPERAAKPPALPPVVRRLIPTEPSPMPSRLDLQLQGGAWISSGGVPVLGMLHLGLRIRLPASFSVTGDLGLSVISGDLHEDGLSSTFDVAEAFFWGAWHPEPVGRVEPAFGLGLGLLIPTAEGTAAEPGLAMKKDDARVGAVACRFDLLWRLTPRVAANFSVTAGFAFPEISVRFGDKVVAHAGHPFSEVLAGLRISLF
jgi:hypothetical protein